LVKFFLLEADDNPGAGAELDQRDLPRTETTKALIIDITAQQIGATTAVSRENAAAQLDQLRIGAAESNRVSEIDGEDLLNWNILLGNHTPFDSGATDNARVTTGMVYPMDPFMLFPQIDYNQPFGLTGRVARKVEFLYAADGATATADGVDDKRMAIGIVTTPAQSSGGYVAFHRDTYTGVNNVNNFTDVVQPGKLLGVHGFETSSWADELTDGDHRTGSSIQEVAITIDRKDVLGPVYPTTIADFNGQYEIGGPTDEGHFFWNFGMHNRNGALGLPTGNARIPNNMECRQKGGSALGAIRIHTVTLNDNV